MQLSNEVFVRNLKEKLIFGDGNTILMTTDGELKCRWKYWNSKLSGCKLYKRIRKYERDLDWYGIWEMQYGWKMRTIQSGCCKKYRWCSEFLEVRQYANEKYRTPCNTVRLTKSKILNYADYVERMVAVVHARVYDDSTRTEKNTSETVQNGLRNFTEARCG